MHTLNYIEVANSLLTPEIVNMVSAIHEFRGQQNLFIEAKTDVLSSLLEIAKIQSVESSNRIEGIRTTDKRIAELVYDKAEPRNRDENEIAGYRDVLATIHENYDNMPLRSNLVLQLHKNLYRYSPSSIGGHYKMTDNSIAEFDADGNAQVRFTPVASYLTEDAMRTLCEGYNQVIKDTAIDPLLVIPALILDFLCIHPFTDGNGRMSRLLTLLLLYREGYIVGSYISIEMLIEKTKDTYYDALKASSSGWHDNTCDYKPFTRYTLGVLIAAYKEFVSRVEYLTTKGLSKPERIETLLKNTPEALTSAQILQHCPDISASTLNKTLGALQKAGKIVKVSGGRYARYTYRH